MAEKEIKNSPEGLPGEVDDRSSEEKDLEKSSWFTVVINAKFITKVSLMLWQYQQTFLKLMQL